MDQSRLDVSKWHEGRREWQYTPTLWFFHRMIEVAYLDALSTDRVEGPLRPGEKSTIKPTNEALLARDWIARSESIKGAKFVSFPECCEMLGLNADAQRVALLEAIDAHVVTDTPECWERLEALGVVDPVDDDEPLFKGFRVVPALDQIPLFI